MTAGGDIVVIDCGKSDIAADLYKGYNQPRNSARLLLTIPADEAAAILAAFTQLPVQPEVVAERSGDRGSAGRLESRTEKGGAAACTEDPQKNAEDPERHLRASA